MNNLGGSYCFSLTDIFNMMKKLKIDVSRTKLPKKDIAKDICQDFIKLLLDDIISTGVRFKFSAFNKYNMQIHIEPITGEDFAQCRKNGKFYDVDPLLSNFTGNHLVVSWRTLRYTFTRKITVDNAMKDIITRKTNNGELFMGRMVTIYDYSERVAALYPEITERDIRTILNLFQIQLMYLVLKRVSVIIKPISSCRSGNYFFLLNGIATYNSLSAYIYWKKQMVKKIRTLYRAYNRKWDGYYYFALSDIGVAKMLALIGKNNKRKNYVFENLKMFKLFEECLTQEFGKNHVFRVPYIIDFGWSIFNENCTLGDFEYIYRVEKEGLVPVTKITTRCDNNLFALSRDFLWLKWIDKNLIKTKNKKNA